MARPMFTPEELEELRRFDEELDEEFVQTQEEIRESRKRDRESKLLAMEPEKRRIAEYQAAYREANRDKIAERNAAYRENNRAKYNAYQREYQRKRREAKRMAAGAGALIPSVGCADSSPFPSCKGSLGRENK